MSLDTRIADAMASVFEIPASGIGEHTSVDTVESWDSLRAMLLVTVLEEEFGVQFTDQEILEMGSFPLIKLTLQEKGVS